jgi:hypothetical protein
LKSPFIPTESDKLRIFNTGSPFNVVAGQGARNMDQLVAHYDKLNADEEAKKAEALSREK